MVPQRRGWWEVGIGEGGQKLQTSTYKTEVLGM